MYAMRPAALADVEGITRVIDLRCADLIRRHSIRNEANTIRSLMAQPGPFAQQVWVFTDETVPRAPYDTSDEAPVAGCLLLTDQVPHTALWSRQELAEPSLSLGHVYSHPGPAQSRVGWMMACWALDHVARTYPQAEWARCAVPHRRLLHLLRDRWGWTHIRSGTGADGTTVHLLQHRPETKPGLTTLIPTGPSALLGIPPTTDTPVGTPPQAHPLSASPWRHM
ncbi:hypothetical protein [Streptomyces sp. BPTC-684]|uniref:hypothetical protein n=1 Tax=Streptomyces sp. BPTC-684 TaxID=3043734 RepID=UPI0024B144C1|nr:hypothetical protein [Streptomyces sp. BPTC-684]WHM36606.1 hypothetical protein QIY60_06400 [Streptomyces sp. BPTC-684]